MNDTLNLREIATFFTQLNMVLKSGISLTEGLGILAEDAASSFAKDILDRIHLEVELGAPLHMALAKTDKFPTYVVSMVEIGEASGRLEKVTLSLAKYYEREENIRKQIKSSVTYPLIMIGVMLTVIVMLVVQVMPIFNQVFVSLGSQMSGVPQMVLNFGIMLGDNGWIILGLLAAIVAAIVLFLRTEGGKRATQHFKENSALTRNLYHKISSGRFASAMALMLASGMETDRSLDMVHKLVETPTIQAKINICQKELAAGASFADALATAGLFSGINQKMITVAFKTGNLDGIMDKLAQQQEEETTQQLDGIISFVEPTIVAVLSVVVGLILLSVMLPLMEIMSVIG